MSLVKLEQQQARTRGGHKVACDERDEAERQGREHVSIAMMEEK